MPCLPDPAPATATPARRCSRRCAPTRARTAILTDIDGTLAPIVERPEQAAVPSAAVRAAGGAERALRRWSAASPAAGRPRRGAWSASRGSPTPATTASSCCCRATRSRASTPRSRGARTRRRSSSPGSTPDELAALGLRTEDKGPIQALHWRGAEDERAAEARAHEIAADAGRAGLEPHWGRKVLELRPVGGGGKDAAVAALLAADGFAVAAYAGDDRTDLDAFRRLRELREQRRAGDRDLRRRQLAGGAAGARRGVRPARRRPRRAGSRCSSRWRPSRALHRPAPPLGLPHRRRGDRAGRDRGARGGPQRQPEHDPDRRRRLVARGARRRPLPGAPGARRRRRPRRPRPSAHRDQPAPGDRHADRPRRLWPIGAIALVAGVLGIFFPGVAIVGAGYALLVSLAWRSHEAAVLGVEQRDGTKFYVVPNIALRPVELVRTPGLRSDRLCRRRRPDARALPGLRSSSFLNSRQPRVLATSAAVSQARRAVATP